jgi:glutamate N-acetyltransferase/amino-acid N-acetyltransferase
VLACSVPARFAGAFTQNAFAAAPVIHCREICATQDRIRALAINSGNANACTGPQGLRDTKRMADITADALNVKDSQVMVFSTGRIGVQLPMDKVEKGLQDACSDLSSDASMTLAEAIMTTDTVPKSFAISVDINGFPVTIGGTSKGAGMIEPKMRMAEKQATMFSFITTDAVLDDGLLESTLNQSLTESFNRITIDGDTSTNDSFVAMSSELAGNMPIRRGTMEEEKFVSAFNMVAAHLAKLLVLDGEGVTRFVEVKVTGAHDDAEAETCARAIGNSLLCKTAWFGADPNWGRILDAAGYSGVDVDPSQVALYYEDVPVVKNGTDAGKSEKELAEIVQRDEFHMELNLGVGQGEFTVWTCDLSYEYVKINADYHT